MMQVRTKRDLNQLFQCRKKCSFMALLGRLLSGLAEPQHICRGKIVEAGGRLACLATDKLATTEMPARRLRLRRIFWRTLTSELRVALVPPLVRMLTANNSGVRVPGERMPRLLCRRTPRPGSQWQRQEGGRHAMLFETQDATLRKSVAKALRACQ